MTHCTTWRQSKQWPLNSEAEQDKALWPTLPGKCWMWTYSHMWEPLRVLKTCLFLRNCQERSCAEHTNPGDPSLYWWHHLATPCVLAQPLWGSSPQARAGGHCWGPSCSDTRNMAHGVLSLWCDLTASSRPRDILAICSYRWHIHVRFKKGFSKRFLFSLFSDSSRLADAVNVLGMTIQKEKKKVILHK